ncbi:hypothetical protein AMTRI_Chr09g33970 [Amborella trichopoda]|uniref:RWP-RK domain-containing protein n=1 Tax=Amborella trichopoda TaxID=13333 RepID=U5D717_AMBTC|nr:protein RKD5 [Amborella trichopoda]ERN17212.1 hypothetical protein AMTR_s00044p00165760 [Amborella trichopoda]|eukprot:XP_006855745.1 protein RKD5 [Amborella trichopoda]
MDSFATLPLRALAVFRNVLNEELVKSVHVYLCENGKEITVEREFMFCPNSYKQMTPIPNLVHGSSGFNIHIFNNVGAIVEAIREGQQVGLWLCILLFNSHHPPVSSPLPALLTISRNPKLKSIPTLANDLQKVSEFRCAIEDEEVNTFDRQESTRVYEFNFFDKSQIAPVVHTVPSPSSFAEGLSKIQHIGNSIPVRNKVWKNRAPTKHVASIALSDLSKHFNVPMAEASRNLKVGLTVLKRKCREFGIPRWPHRKIKSLDSLIHDLQDEVKRQERENEAAAKAATKRRKLLERERETIERRPASEIQSETKRFRQDVFKRRHKAKALSNKVATSLRI